jgi:hypothetical protein
MNLTAAAGAKEADADAFVGAVNSAGARRGQGQGCRTRSGCLQKISTIDLRFRHFWLLLDLNHEQQLLMRQRLGAGDSATQNVLTIAHGKLRCQHVFNL